MPLFDQSMGRTLGHEGWRNRARLRGLAQRLARAQRRNASARWTLRKTMTELKIQAVPRNWLSIIAARS
jgi:hypothetical protein